MAELQSHKKYTPDEVWDLCKKMAFVDLNRRYFLPFILEAVKEYGQQGSPEVQAANLIASWSGYRSDDNTDGKYDSQGQTIFQTWLGTMLSNTFSPQGQPVLGSFTAARLLGTGYPASPPTGSTNVSTGSKVLYHALLGPASTVPNNYDFFKGVDPLQVVFQSLTGTISNLQAKYLTADMSKWLLPVVPQEFFFTNYNGIPQADPDENLFLPIQMNRGTENHMVVLDHKGVSGVNVCPPGESGFVSPQGVKDPHYQDQMELYNTFGAKPMLFYPESVTHTSDVQVLDVK
jgi:penicillin amidase